jgi:hypothetical protein
MKKITLLLMALIFISAKLSATAQLPDKIIFEGEEYSLLSNPLEAYFEKYPNMRPTTEVGSTGLWRGYVATFEFIDSVLYVKDIQIRSFENRPQSVIDLLPNNQYQQQNNKIIWKSVIDEVFPTKEKVKVDWMSGLLVLPVGKIKNYVHMGYASTYYNYILLEIDNGILKQSERMNENEYAQFRNKKFEEFKKTKEYKKLKKELLKNSQNSEEFIDEFLRIYVH